MTRLATLTTACLLVFAGAAHAQRVSPVRGVTLMKACTAPSSTVCDAYVDGYGDAIEAEGKADAVACIPIAATGTELRDVVVRYLKGHPEDQHEQAALIVKQAFSKAYPCNK